MKNQPKKLGWWVEYTPLVIHNHKNKTKQPCPPYKFIINIKITLGEFSFYITKKSYKNLIQAIMTVHLRLGP